MFKIKERFACLSKLKQTNRPFLCGKWGIRTLDTLARIPHFECGSFDHSDNFPYNATAKVLLFSQLRKCDTIFSLFFLFIDLFSLPLWQIINSY